jgi:hypothetical protein
MTDAEFEHYRYRPLRLRLYDATISAILCCTVGGIAAFAVSGYPRYAILVTGVIATVLAVRRSFRIELYVSRQMIQIRNYWRTFELQWSDVTDVGTALQTMGFVPLPAIYFLLRDGQNARAQATPSDLNQRQNVLKNIGRLAPSTVVIHSES